MSAFFRHHFPLAMSAPESRKEKAIKIAANPSAYKVCEGCDSIVSMQSVLCPNCHSFRFDISATSVIKQAKMLGNREQNSVTSSDLF
jgi:Zn finger protein HypA/HybF involved in hydrogenase expression